MATNSAAIPELIPTEKISDYVALSKRSPSLSAHVAWAEQVPPNSGPVYHWPRINRLTLSAGTTNELTAYNVLTPSTDVEACTAGRVGNAVRVADNVAYDAQRYIPTRLVDELLAACRTRFDRDLYAVATGSETLLGTDATEFDLDHLDAGLNLFMEQNPTGQPVCLVSPGQWAQLKQSLRTTAASFLAGPQAQRPAMAAAAPGYLGRYENVDLYVTDDLPAVDTGTCAIITEPGRFKSGLGAALWQPLRVRIDIEALTASQLIVADMRYSATLTRNPDDDHTNLVALVSAAAPSE